MKTSFDKLLDALLPDRIAQRRRVEAIYDRAGWLKFSQPRLVASGHKSPPPSTFRAPEVRDEWIHQSPQLADVAAPVAIVLETAAEESIDAPLPDNTPPVAIVLETAAEESTDAPLPDNTPPVAIVLETAAEESMIAPLPDSAASEDDLLETAAEESTVAPLPDNTPPVAIVLETAAEESIDAPLPDSTASEDDLLETAADESIDALSGSWLVSPEDQTPEAVAEPALVDLSDLDEELPVLEDQPEQRQDLSHLLGFKELASAARQTVRDLTGDSRVEAAVRSQKSAHWMAAALSHAGVPWAHDLPLHSDMDSEEVWATAREWCRVSSSEICEAVARQFCLKSVDLESLDISRIPDIPDSLLRKYQAVPVAQGSRYLILAVSDPSDPHLERDFSFVTGKSVALTVAPPEAIVDTLWNTYGWIF